MAVNLGGAYFGVRVDTKKFKKDLDTAKGVTTKATKQMQSSFERVKKSMMGMSTAMKAFSGIAIAGTFTAMIKSSFQLADGLAKTADKLGMTTEGLASLRYAADLTGVSTQSLDMSIMRMTRRVAEAAQGTGEAKKALIQLGLSAKSLMKLRPEQMFSEIAEKMKGVANQSEQVRLAFQIFGREGISMINTARLGKEGLAELAKQAEKLGIAFSRVDAAKIEAANDAITTMKEAFKGLSNQVAIGIAGPIKEIADGVVRLLELNKEIKILGIEDVGIVGLLLFGKFGAAKIVIAAKAANYAMKQVGMGVGTLKKDFQDASHAINMFWKEVSGQVTHGRVVASGKISDLLSKSTPLKSAGGKPSDVPSGGPKAAGAKTGPVSVWSNLGITADDPMTMANWVKEAEGVIKVWSNINAIDQDPMGLADWTSEFADTSIFDKIKTNFSGLFDDLLSDSSKFGDVLKNQTIGLAISLDRAYEQFFFDAIEGRFTSMGDFFNNWLKSLQQQLIQELASYSKTAIKGVLGKAFGSLTGGGPASGSFSAGGILSNIFGGIKGVLGFANGGLLTEPVFGIGKSGRGYSFGEKGPERISPMGKGGMGPVFNVNVSAPNGNISRESLGQLQTVLGSSVQRAMARNG